MIGVVCLLASIAAVQACLPAPYLYITFHAGTSLQPVGAWTRDGCALPTPLSGGSIVEPRGFARRESDGALLLADASTGASRIMQFQSCAKASNGIRSYERNVLTESSNAGLDHPYGIAENPNSGILYASNQHTNVVLGFNSVSGSPIAAASYLNGSAQFAGEFAQFQIGSQGVRGVTRDGNGDLWIASEDDNGIYAFDGVTGYPFAFVALDSPVGVYWDNTTNAVFASSHSKDNSQVVSIDVPSAGITGNYVNPAEQHPAGMVVYGDTLFVVGQDSGSLYSFAVSTGTLNTIVPALGGTGEQIILSEC